MNVPISHKKRKDTHETIDLSFDDSEHADDISEFIEEASSTKTVTKTFLGYKGETMYYVRKKGDMTEEPCLLCGNKTCLRVGQSSNCSESKRPKTWKRYTLKSKYSSMKSEHKTTAKHCISCLQNVDEDYQSLGQLKFCDICNGENK